MLLSGIVCPRAFGRILRSQQVAKCRQCLLLGTYLRDLTVLLCLLGFLENKVLIKYCLKNHLQKAYLRIAFAQVRCSIQVFLYGMWYKGTESHSY